MEQTNSSTDAVQWVWVNTWVFNVHFPLHFSVYFCFIYFVLSWQWNLMPYGQKRGVYMLFGRGCYILMQFKPDSGIMKTGRLQTLFFLPVSLKCDSECLQFCLNQVWLVKECQIPKGLGFSFFPINKFILLSYL